MLNQEFDAFITGSDQVFNVKAIDKKGYCFLRFAEAVSAILVGIRMLKSGRNLRREAHF